MFMNPPGRARHSEDGGTVLIDNMHASPRCALTQTTKHFIVALSIIKGSDVLQSDAPMTSLITTATPTPSFADLVLVLTLLVLVVAKELLLSSLSRQDRAVSRALNVALAPLMMAFIVAAFVRLVDLLS